MECLIVQGIGNLKMNENSLEKCCAYPFNEYLLSMHYYGHRDITMNKTNIYPNETRKAMLKFFQICGSSIVIYLYY